MIKIKKIPISFDKVEKIEFKMLDVVAEHKIATINLGHEFDMETEVEKACDFIRASVKSWQKEYPSLETGLTDQEIAQLRKKVNLNMQIRFRY